MSSRIYVSTIEASYFETHILGCSASPPVKGNHTIGDIYISSIQQDDIFGWVCIEAGSPGVWKIICDVTMIKNNIQEHTTDINKLLKFMEETEGEINGINTKNDNQDRQIVQIIKDLESLNKLVTESDSSLIGAVHINTGEIQKLAAEVANNKQGINKNKEDIVNINGQVNNINNSMNTISSQVITNTSDISKLKEDINNMNEDVDSILSDMEKIYDLQQGVTNNNNAIRKLESDVNTNKVLINGIQQDNADILNKVDNNILDIEDIQKEVSGLQNDVNELKDFVNDNLEQDLEELDDIRQSVDDNKQEIANLKQGLVDALVSKGANVNKNTSWVNLFKEILNQIDNSEDPVEPGDPDPEDPVEPGDPDPENPGSNSISLFKNGVVNNETDFKKLAIGDSSANITLTNNGIRCATGLYTDKGYFSFTGYTDFTNYECVGFKVYTERVDHQPTIGIATTTKSGQYSHSSLDTWEGTDRGSVKIMTNTEPTMYYFDIRDVNEQGYLLFWTGNADDVSESYTYITDIVVYKNGDYYPR
jgi:predicted  nucleic acid-binding Zn-ribbon protein